MCQKLNIWYVSIHTYVVSGNIPFSTKAFLILLMLAYFFKNQHFLAKIVPLAEAILWEMCYWFFSFIFSLCKIKGYYYENVSFSHYASGIPLPDCSKFAINRKNNNDVTIHRHDVIVNFFDVVLFLLSSLVNGPSFISISLLVLELWQFTFISDWPEILKSEIPSSEFFQISGDWSKLEIPNLALMSRQNVTKCCKMPGLQLLPFWIIKGKLTGEVKLTPPHTHTHTHPHTHTHTHLD